MFAATWKGCIALTLSGLLVGCSTLHKNSANTDCSECVSGTCDSEYASCEACNYGAEIKKGSPEWWAQQAESPVGARQVYKKGKLWPPIPRPTGEKQQFSHKFHAAHYWPHPYVCQDRAYVNNIFEQQVDKGWTQLTTLFNHHFEADSTTLTHAGIEKVVWILEEAPNDRNNTIYVQRMPYADQNSARIENVRSALVELAGENASQINIELQTGSYHGRPAQEIDTIRKAELSSMPEPRIQYTAPSTTSDE